MNSQIKQFNVGDFVKIIKQPQGNHMPHVVGLKGFVEETYSNLDGDPYILFKELKAEGRSGGCGSVPFDCLELLSGPELMQMKKWFQLYDDYLADLMKASQNITQHCAMLKAKALEKLAAYVGLTEAQAFSAFSVFEEYQDKREQALYEYQEGRKNWDNL